MGEVEKLVHWKTKTNEINVSIIILKRQEAGGNMDRSPASLRADIQMQTFTLAQTQFGVTSRPNWMSLDSKRMLK